MSAAVTAPAPVAIEGTLADMKPITPRYALERAMDALRYINQFGFLTEALAGNETTMGAMVLRRELALAKSLITAVLAS